MRPVNEGRFEARWKLAQSLARAGTAQEKLA
jgi:hypothetical protein